MAESSVLLPAPFGPDDDVDAAAPNAQPHVVEQRLAMAPHGEAVDLEERGRLAAVGHASVTSARIIVSTFRCISRSNLSAV